jgi:hypothetical protein
MPRRSKATAAVTPKARTSLLTRYDLYRACVQDPPRMVQFIEAVHANMQDPPEGEKRSKPAKAPLILREDFAGPASLSAAWIDRGPTRRAFAVDLDPEPLSHAVVNPRLVTRAMDVRRCREQADCVALFNFAICELHDRKELLKYFTHLRKNVLRPDGTLIFDLFGGVGSLRPNKVRAKCQLPDGTPIDYTWSVDFVAPLMSMLDCSLHFSLPSEVTSRGWEANWPNAFVYSWRLWSPAELFDALREAGFTRVDVYDRLGNAVDSDGRLYAEPLEEFAELDKDWVVYIVVGF